ncbi:putative collagen-binding domain-containing protein [Leptolyngbya sp. 7M]|uniref:putative collagen-binding domain-containing protein n=1 Tax=Leptolyngbya sp. 7M TaxID=2812896 RepID=UPI001B8D40B2|nr:putative collagen-binding domain-containing protein [Leptolyngbya sp. 7M]QYO64668.1 hypothetical protein JVX88_34475 [Leptolyngbya sp. 7M]
MRTSRRSLSRIAASMLASGVLVAATSPASASSNYKPIQVNLTKLKGDSVNASWYDPRQGIATSIDTFGVKEPSASNKTFAPTTDGRGQDWVLVLDQSDHSFPTPGASGA